MVFPSHIFVIFSAPLSVCFFFFLPHKRGDCQKYCCHFLQHSRCFQASVFILLFSLILLGVSFVLPFTGRLRSENRLRPKVPLLYSLLYFIFRTSLTTPSGFLFGFLTWLKRPSRDRESLTATDGKQEQSQPLHR